MKHSYEIPVVMTLSGNDPTGGSGICADTEAIISHGCHASPVITCITVQDTNGIMNVTPLDPALLIEQARAVLEDIPIAVIKIGLLGSPLIAEAIHSILVDYPDTPMVLDPVLSSVKGDILLGGTEMIDVINTLLVPLATIITPDSHDALRLAPEADNPHAAAIALLDRGAKLILITGTRENTKKVVNVLYTDNRMVESFSWERLPGNYHGATCTLAASIAGLMAQGHEPVSAIHEAQEYTSQSLKHGYRVGMGQMIPNRLFWAGSAKEEDDAT